MITSDSHEWIIKAVRETFPEVPRQRCQFHFSRNISDRAPEKYQAGLRAKLNQMFTAKSIEKARKKRGSAINDCQNAAERTMECPDEGLESSMTEMMLLAGLCRSCRTSSSIEKLNREMKRRSKQSCQGQAGSDIAGVWTYASGFESGNRSGADT